MKKNKQQEASTLALQCHVEQPKPQRKTAKDNVKYVVFMPGKNAWPQTQAPVLNDDPDFDSLKLTIADTVFDNNYYAHLLMQRKYFID